MEGLRQYAVSVVTAALICAILSSLVREGAAKELIRLIGGVFLAFTVLYPLCRLDLGELDLTSFLDAEEASAIAERGAAISRNSMADIIREKTEAYIVDKAAELHAAITAEVTLSGGDPPIPVSVKLRGSASPQVRRQIETYIQTTLGIARKDLEWTG